MPLKIKSSYEALLYLIEDIDIISEICESYNSNYTSYSFSNKNSYIWKILLEKTNDNRNHHYTNRKSLEYLLHKIGFYKNKHTLYNLLKYLYLEHFEIKRGRNILRVDRIESFQFLQNRIDTTPIYAMSISEYIEDFNSIERKIKYLRSSVLNKTIPLPRRFLTINKFSDNHFHLGGGNNYSYRLHKVLQDPLSVKTEHIPENYRLHKFSQNKKYLRFIVYATSTLEQIIIGFIVNNNSEIMKKEKIIDNKNRFKRALKLFSKAMVEKDFHLLDNLVYEFDKDDESIFFDIRPKLDRIYLNSLLVNNYYNEMVYHITRYNLRGDIHKADTFLWVLLNDILRDHKDNILKDFIFIYMSLRNILHGFIIQEQEEGGLEYFSSYSRSDLRRAKKSYEFKDTFKGVLSSDNDLNIEGRIIFFDSEEKLAKELVYWYKSFIETSIELNSKNKLKFMLHFKKSKDIKKSVYKGKIEYLPIRYDKYRKEIFKFTQILLNFLNNKRYKKYKVHFPYETINSKNFKKFQKNNLDIVLNIDEKGKYVILNLHNMISGIDAASLEYNAPPEVFASVYSYIRHSPELLNKSFQFSYHSGEDTEDIVTSLRSIVESIIYLDLKKGDRIGHALSLGIKYNLKDIDNEFLLISNQNALDNAIFLYFIFSSFYNKDDRYKYLSIFEQKIFRLGSEVYTKNYTIQQHINAWLLRRNSPILIKKIIEEEMEVCKKYKDNLYIINDNNVIFDFCKKLNKTEDKEEKFIKYISEFLKNIDVDLYYRYKYLYHYKLFLKYAARDVFKLKNKIDNFCAEKFESARLDVDAWELYYRYQFDKTVRLKGERQIEDKYYDESIITIVQDLIMENIVTKNDIVIEVMPTSNILNSQISSYSEHPIFRFKPVDDNFDKYNIRITALKVIINTDNPGFQATTYQNELFLIYEAAIKLGYNHEDVEKYINEIVEYGNKIFDNIAPQE